MYFEIDEQLYELQKACIKYVETDCLAKWVLYAVHRYIDTDRANKQFLKDFISVNPAKFEHIIAYCLEDDRSDDAIIKKFRFQISKKENQN